MKHTPKPWVIQRDFRYDQDAFSIEKKGNGLRSIIALTNDNWLCEEHGDLMQNAKLIAAAPELLGACQDMIEQLIDVYPDRKKGNGIKILKMMNAIKSAT